jgi:hypothetical protein
MDEEANKINKTERKAIVAGNYKKAERSIDINKWGYIRNVPKR